MKTAKRTLLQRLYKGSNRRHHLKLSRHLTYACIGCTTIIIFHLQAIYIFEQPWRLGLLYIVSLFCWLQELWASPDRDLQENRNGFNYWHPYGRYVKHRSPWSHSLTLGTTTRFIYGYWPLVSLFQVLPVSTSIPVVGLAFLGSLISDAGHLALDGYGAIEMLNGR